MFSSPQSIVEKIYECISFLLLLVSFIANDLSLSTHSILYLWTGILLIVTSLLGYWVFPRKAFKWYVYPPFGIFWGIAAILTFYH